MNFNIPIVDSVYLSELQTQCRFALTAAASSESSLNDRNPNLDEFWYHIQMFLISTANIHKMLNNDKQSKYKDHHDDLKKKYALPNINFENEKKVRNRFEHYDEDLVDWINSSENYRIALNNVMPKKSIGDDIDSFKNFDTLENKLSFGDHEIDMLATCEKINLLYQRLQEILEP